LQRNLQKPVEGNPDDFILVESQNLSMHMYETRIASLQRWGPGANPEEGTV
jgi:hypothetical protein